MSKELGRLIQGFGATKGNDTMQFMNREGIKHMPRDRVVTYTRIVVDYCPQKKDQHQVRITVGGNLIKYMGKLTTRALDLSTSKVI